MLLFIDNTTFLLLIVINSIKKNSFVQSLEVMGKSIHVQSLPPDGSVYAQINTLQTFRSLAMACQNKECSLCSFASEQLYR